MIIPTVIISIVVLLLAFSLIGIRIILKKDGEFRGTCASNNPVLKDKIGDCPVCGGDAAKCENNVEVMGT